MFKHAACLAPVNPGRHLRRCDDVCKIRQNRRTFHAAARKRDRKIRHIQPVALELEGSGNRRRKGQGVVRFQGEALGRKCAAIAGGKCVIANIGGKMLAAHIERGPLLINLHRSIAPFEVPDGQFQKLLWPLPRCLGLHAQGRKIGGSVGPNQHIGFGTIHQQAFNIDIPLEKRDDFKAHLHLVRAKQRRTVRRFRSVEDKTVHSRREGFPVVIERFYLNATAGGVLYCGDNLQPNLVLEPACLDNNQRSNHRRKHGGEHAARAPQDDLRLPPAHCNPLSR